MMDEELRRRTEEEHTVRGSTTLNIIQKAQHSCRGRLRRTPFAIVDKGGDKSVIAINDKGGDC